MSERRSLGSNMDPGDVKSDHPVFLCHSGAQKGFVEQLDKDLRNVDRYPFFDKNRKSLPIGDNFPDRIFEAIKHCQVGVVVMSEEFFMRSHWPMFEVAKMVEFERKIMPIFLGISPEDLSKETNLGRWKSHWEGWKESNKRIDIPKWEEALRYLRPLNGLVYNAAVGEVKFREDIVKEICKRVPTFHRWDDTHVQGKSRLSKIIREKIGETAIDGVRVVGLHGVGGIGKTTACKSVCNDVLKEFGGRVCYLEFGNGTSSKERVEEVLRRLTSTSNEFLKDNSLHEDKCWNRLKDLMPENKVFLAIDNVSSDSKVSEEAREFLKLEYFQGSVVMVTARGLEQLIDLGVDGASCLAMPELVEDEARDLFLCCAGREDVVDEGVVRYCIKRCYFGKGDGKGGHYHPLALKVLGNQMVGRDPGKWMSQLEDVEDVLNQRREQEHPVFSILRRSFDELLDEDKALFMDVALIDVEYQYSSHRGISTDVAPIDVAPIDVEYQYSFHRGTDIGKRKMEWLSIVHGLNLKVLKERLNGLKKRALLDEVGDGSKQVGMHDLWREFAMKETKRGEQEGRSWVYEVVEGEGEDSCLSGGGWKKLRRICITSKRGDWPGGLAGSVKCVELSDCSKVTVLSLVDVNVDNQELDLSPLSHLKSLEINVERYCDWKRALRVSGIGQLRNLAVLVLYGVSIPSSSAFGEISWLRNLQVLHLVFLCEKWDLCTRLDLGMQRLLQQVRLRCSRMVTLSGLSSRMSQLRILDLAGCDSLRSCPGVGDVVGLEVLLLSRCSTLEELPNLERMTKLRVLVISVCRLLKALPGLGSLVALQVLRAVECSELDELPDIRRLTNLEVLDLKGCRSLKSTPPGFGNLVALHTFRVPGAFMRNWPNLRKLTMFDEVAVNGPHGLQDSYLGYLDDGICYIDATAGFGEGSKLCWDLAGLNVSTLRLREVRQDFELTNLSTLTALKRLEMVGCSLERLPDMGKDMTLESLTISQCGRLSGWDGVGRLGMSESGTGEVDGHCDWTLPELQELEWYYSGVVEIPDLSHFPRLRTLTVYNGFGVQCRGKHEHLEVLSLERPAIPELPDLRNFPRLGELKLNRCRNLTSLINLSSSTALKRLEMVGCSLERLPDMGKDMTLESLTISQCGRLSGWDGVGRLGMSESGTGEVDGHCDWTLPELQELKWDYSGVAELPDLSHFPRLRTLRVYNGFGVQCRGKHEHLEVLSLERPAIPELPDLGNFPRLIVLRIECCNNLTSLTCSGPLLSLESLCLVKCRRLVDIPSFDLFPGVRYVEIRGVKVNDFGLTNLSSSTALTRLEMVGCSLERLPDMGKDMTLKSLKIRRCNKLRGWDGVGRLGMSDSGTGEVDGHCNWTLPELQQLQWWQSGVVELPDLSHFPRLRTLSVNHSGVEPLPSGWPHFAVQCRDHHVHLKFLVFENSPISELPDLRKFPALRVLRIHYCDNLTSLTCSGPLLSLQILRLRYCRRLGDLPSFDLLPELRVVDVWQSRRVKLNAQVVEDMRARCSYLRVGRKVYGDWLAEHTEEGISDGEWDISTATGSRVPPPCDRYFKESDLSDPEFDRESEGFSQSIFNSDPGYHSEPEAFTDRRIAFNSDLKFNRESEGFTDRSIAFNSDPEFDRESEGFSQSIFNSDPGYHSEPEGFTDRSISFNSDLEFNRESEGFTERSI